MTSATFDWISGLEDVAQVNRHIQQLERERELAQAKSHATGPQHQHAEEREDNEVTQRARDLASQLEIAIRSEDIDTLNALAISHGDIQSIAAAKNLINEKKRLTKLREQRVTYDELRIELSHTIDYDFHSLKNLKERVSKVQDQSLQSQLSSSIDAIVLSYKDEYTQRFTEELSHSRWTQTGSFPVTLTTAFTDLINLQSLLKSVPSYPHPLWAFATVSESFRVSFDYHFNSDKDTNRIDRPELFLTYLLKYLTNHITNIHRGFHLQNTEFPELDAHTEFITAAIVPVREKLQQCIKTLRESTEDPSYDEVDLRLLIHLIRETVSFDETLVREFYYDPFNDGMWPGLFGVFEYTDLEKWLNLEIKLSLQNFESIVNAPNVFQIDYTSVEIDELKPTVSAIKLRNVFDGTTRTFQKFFIQNYSNNNALQKFKLKLFSKLYLKFLELYYERLLDGYLAYESLFKSTKSLLQPKKGAEIDISGVNGLERLFRLYCSLKYVTRSLNVWNHELIFVELNDLYNFYSNSKSESLFSSIMEDYDKLQTQVFNLIIDFYHKTMKSLLEKYGYLNIWNNNVHDTDGHQFTLSNELVSLIDKLQDLNEFSSKVLSSRDTCLIKNSISLYVADYLFQYIIKGNHFNENGIKQLSLDFSTVWEKLELKTNFPVYYKLVQGLQLLNLKDDQIREMGNYGSLSQFTRAGEFSGLRDAMELGYLRDGDILDILLRIH